MTRAPADREAGFTLIELIIALALFGLIAIAGLSLVESMLGIRARTDGRLDRLAEVERAMFVIDADLEQLSDGPISERGGILAFRRHAPSPDGHGETVRYTILAGNLDRMIGDGGAGDPPRIQHLLTQVGQARWSYYVAGGGWRAGWPPDPRRPDVWPAGIALDLSLADRGSLRRVVDLPARPTAPGP